MRKILMIAACLIAGINANGQSDTIVKSLSGNVIIWEDSGPTVQRRQLYIDSMMARQKELFLKLADQHSKAVCAAVERDVKGHDREDKRFGEILLEIYYNVLLIENEYKAKAIIRKIDIQR